MSITITTDVFCDRCTEWVHGTTGMRPAHREARREAKARGWVHRDGVDLCPDCLEREQLVESL